MSLIVKSVQVPKLAIGQVRGMATEKQILQRITSTSNIAKITKSMKMVSAAKMRGAQNRLNAGRPFAVWLDNLSGKANSIENEGSLKPEELDDGVQIFVPITSDRGLCGGCNSIIVKTTRSAMHACEAAGKKTSAYLIGEKGRSQLRRQVGPSITNSITECWTPVPSFSMASAIAEGLIRQDYGNIHLVFNIYKSAIQYLPSIRTIKLWNVDSEKEPFLEYEFEPDNKREVLKDLQEFQLASAIYHGMIEAGTSEESSRMAAMENATTNAEDLIANLTLVYNKARQARITTELIEIISGASSLDG